MYRLPDDFPGSLNAYSELFNATTSDINLGVQSSQAVGEQTTLAYIKTAGAGEANFGYIWGQTPSASSNGPRLYVFDDGVNATRRFIFQGHSTGTAGAPGRQTANDSATIGQWFHVGATWDGGLAATGIKIYYGKGGAPLGEETAYTSPTDGTGSVSLGASNEFHIGNRAGTDRTFNGQIAYVARWNRVLSKQELLTAQVFGPESVPEGLILNWRSGEDYGPLGLKSVSKTAVVQAAAPPFMPIHAPAMYSSVPSGETIGCGLGTADASGFPATIGSNTTIECGVGAATAAGLSCALGSAVVIECALGTATASGLQASLQTIFIQDDYERSSVNLAASSVAGDGDSAVITIRPRVQESEVKSSLTAWLEPSARIVGVNGVRPTLRFSGYAATWSDGTYHGVPWGTGRRPMFSYDRLTWTYFDTQTITGTYIEFRHNTAFTSDTVYISRERQVNVTQVGEWLDDMAAAHPALFVPTTTAAAFTPTLTSWPAQQFIANEYSSQTNELGATIPATPFYAAEINDASLVPDSGAKRVAVMTGGVHAGEDTGNWAMMRAVEYLLGSSVEAQNIRRNFRILLYPMVNAPGRYGGGWRGSYTQGTGGADDANRHFNETGSALEIIDRPKAALTIDRAGVVPAFMIDWHGAFEQPWGYFSGSNALVEFGSRISTAFGTSLVNMGPLSSGALTEYGRNTLGCRLAITIEFGNNVTVTDAQYESFGVATIEALDSLIADDFFGIDCTTATATASGFAAEIFSPVNIECSAGAAVASGWPAAIGSGIEIICAPGVAIAAGAPAVIGSADVLECALGIGAASGYSASVTGGVPGMTLTEADIAAIAQAVATAVWSKILP